MSIQGSLLGIAGSAAALGGVAVNLGQKRASALAGVKSKTQVRQTQIKTFNDFLNSVGGRDPKTGRFTAYKNKEVNNGKH